MAVTAPPKPPQRDDPEALIKEARRRQRRRQLLVALCALALVSVGVASYRTIVGHGHRGSAEPRGGSAAIQRRLPPSRLVFVGSRLNTTDSLIAANPATGSCRVLNHLGGATGVIVNGHRLAYVGNRVETLLWVGRDGKRLHRVRIREAVAGPFWIGDRIAYASGRRIYFVGGGSIAPRLPRGSRIYEVATHGNRLAVYASWGGFELKGGLFLVSEGRTHQIETEPRPDTEGPNPVWSPDGQRIGITKNGDVWTIRPDGSGAVRLTFLGHPAQNARGHIIWSPDSRRIAYASRPGGLYTAENVFVVRATGGMPARLTHVRGTDGRSDSLYPLAWLGNEIAIVANGGLYLVPATGGARAPLCRQYWPVSGPVSWRSVAR